MDKFIVVKKKAPINSEKTIFYVNWTDNQPVGQWIIDKPKETTYHTLIKWKETGYTIILACCDINQEKYEHNADNKEKTSTKNESLLKSNLQKCIRRQLKNKALSTANELIKMDVVSFLRRLPIIMLEDVILHESIAPLIWLSAAISKGYLLTYKQIEWCLGIIENMCEQNIYDPIRHNDTNIEHKINTLELFKTIDNSNIIDTQKNVLLSLLLRISYGGMHGDMNMIYKCILTWLDRCNKGNLIPCETIDRIETQIGDDSYIIAASADFHCFPQILKIIQKKYPLYSVEDIKKCIWECSSKLNTREQHIVEEKWLSMWQIINKYVISLQSNLIQ